MVFSPKSRGTAPILQIVEPVANPSWPPLFPHVTCVDPVPPDALPLIAIEDSVVLEATAGLCTVSSSGAELGAGVFGAGVSGAGALGAAAARTP